MNDDVRNFVDALRRVRASLADRKLEPDPRRRGRADFVVTPVVSDLRRAVLSPLSPVLATVAAAEPDAVPHLRDAALTLAVDVAGALVASGDVDGGKRLLREAQQLAAGSSVTAEIAAAHDAPEAFALLTHGRWLLAHQRFFRGERRLKAALALAGPPSTSGANTPSGSPVSSSSGASLRPFITEALTGPRPMSGAPTMQTINGIGTSLHGKHSEAPDGSYIATLFFTFLFVPLVPLSAWRVTNEGGNSYRFYARYPLGRMARTYLAGLVVCGSLGFTTLVVANALDTPARRAETIAQTARAAATPIEATVAWEQLLHDEPDAPEAMLVEAATAWWQVRRAEVVRPMTDENVGKTMRVLDSMRRFPAVAKTTLGAAVLPDVDAWLAELATAPVARRTALARRIADVFSVPRWREYAVELETRDVLADAEQWPALTATRLLAIEGTASREAAGRLLAAAPSAGALATVEPQARAFVAVSRTADADAVRRHLAVVDERVKAPERIAALATDATAEQRAAWLAGAADDQPVVAAVAFAALAANDMARARAVIEAAAPRGWWGPDLLEVGAELALASDDLVAADQLLSRAVTMRVPRYVQALDAVERIEKKIEQSLYDSANAGTLPADVMSQLKNADAAEQGRLFTQLYQQRAAASDELLQARAALEQHIGAVGLSLRAGTVKLRLAAGLDEQQQRVLLQQAEEVFTTIATSASNDPGFQLGLGEVKYRTGKPEEGQKLFEAAVAQGSWELSMSVVHRYRNLGEVDRARTVAKQIFTAAEAKTPARFSSATVLALMSDDDDETISYLEQANTELSSVQAQLASARGRKFAGEGKEREADAEYQKAISLYEKYADIEDGAANNAALASLARYSLTGDRKHVVHGRQLLEKARRITPMSGIIVGNLAEATKDERMLALLDPALNLQALRPTRSESATLLHYATRATSSQPSLFARWQADLGKTERLYDELRVLTPTSTLAWSSLHDVYEARKDVEALHRLERALTTARLDTSDEARASTTWTIADGIEHATTVQQRYASIKPTDAPTRGALLLLRGINELRRAVFANDAAGLASVGPMLVDAEQLWPALDLRPLRATVLLEQALLAVRAAGNAEAASDEVVRLADSDLLLGLASGRYPSLKAPLVAQPAFAESLALRAAADAERGAPRLSTWAMATIAGDTAQATASADFGEAYRSSTRITALLTPWDTGNADAAKLLASIAP